ncbi:unnamed protein product [Hanseniaspora opuntiae]
MLESNDKVDAPASQYKVETFDYNLKKEKIVFIKDDLPEEFLDEDEKEPIKDSESEQSDDEDEDENEKEPVKEHENDDEDSDDESDDEDDEDKDQTRAQTHAPLPNWLLTLAFIALFVYILKHLFDTIIKKNYFSKDQVHSKRLHGSEGSNPKQIHSKRLNDDLEPGLGNSEFDIELDNNELDSNVLDDLDITKD